MSWPQVLNQRVVLLAAGIEVDDYFPRQFTPGEFELGALLGGSGEQVMTAQ